VQKFVKAKVVSKSKRQYEKELEVQNKAEAKKL